MIFFSESGLTDPAHVAEWDAWYPGHLTVMVSVPGISSAQRFHTLTAGVPPSLAMYSVVSADVFESENYLAKRGMGPFVAMVDETLHRRNLFDGLASAPPVAAGHILLVADRDQPEPGSDDVTWLRSVGLDRSVAYRGIAVFSDENEARQRAARLGGAALYAPMTERLTA